MTNWIVQSFSMGAYIYIYIYNPVRECYNFFRMGRGIVDELLLSYNNRLCRA